MAEPGSVPLRLLLVEDCQADEALLLHELRGGGFEPQHLRVDSAAEMRAALARQRWDLVIADHDVRQFGPEDAHRLLRFADPDVAFVVVAGNSGDGAAIAATKSRGHDCILKDDLTRLVPAVERELREARHRRERRTAEETIRRLACHDALTGLLNRNQFQRRLERALRDARVGRERHVLLYIDLDQFKVVNDTCGHAAGDELIRQLAIVLQRMVRGSDSLARLGGDEFGILLAGCPLEDGQRIAQEMLEAVRGFRLLWEGKSFSINASIGLVPIAANSLSATEALRLADLACYAAKDLGRNRVHAYQPNDSALTRRHGEMHWVSRLGEAIERDELLLHVQPIVSLGACAEGPHCELLLRLREPDGRLVDASAFIPAAERYSLMPKLDRWVIHQALTQLSQRARQGRLQPGTTHFINLSGSSLSDDTLPLFIREQLETSSVPPFALGFELTETAAISHFDNALALIDAMRRLQCRVALDDFGTGMSSFAYLKTMQVDHLKIDGSFVRTILDDPMDAAIVETINRVAHVAGVRTVAEHAESLPILDKLRELGVDYAQGHAVGRPGPWTPGSPAARTRTTPTGILPSPSCG
jgi:diguanylate cyclase (GGDEF)-like protein